MNHGRCKLGLMAWVAGLAVCGVAAESMTTPEAALPPGEMLSSGTSTHLHALLREGALTNAGVRAAFERWKAAEEAVPQASALPDPRLSYTYYAESVETRVGPQRHRVGVSQPLPWFGTRGLRAEAANEGAAVARYHYEKVLMALLFRVEHGYFDLWLLGRSIELAQEHLRLVTELEGVVRTQLAAGAASHGVLAQTQVELGRLTDRLQSLQARDAPTRARLNAALGRPLHQPLQRPVQLPASELPVTDSEFLAAFAQASPELAQLEHLAMQAEKAMALTHRERYPDLSLGLAYIETGPAEDPTSPDSGKDPILATVSLALPLWYGKERAAEAEAQLRYEAARHTQADAQTRLAAELESLLVAYRDAGRRAELYDRTLVPKAREAMLVTRRAFEAGHTNFTQLIDAQRVLLELELTQARARAAQGQRLAELKRLTSHRIQSPDEPTKTEEGDDPMKHITALLTAATLLTTPVLAGETAVTAETTQVKAKGKPQTVCPVMGGKINKKQFADVQGKRIYVCCPGCIKLIEAKPKVYIKKLEDAGVAITPTPKAEKPSHESSKTEK